MKLRFWTVLACIFLTGCSTKYFIKYDTTIKCSNSTTDSELNFKFIPLYNGIMFTIINNSNKTVRVLWDKSYFIMPNGNSTKALNPDLLREEQEIVIKSSNESTVPSRSEFSRFTTSTLNATKFAFSNISSFYTRIESYETSSIRIINDEFVRSDNYWPYKIKVKAGSMIEGEKNQSIIKQLENISNFVELNNNLGVGFVIESSGLEVEYRFDISIDKIHIIKKVFEPPSRFNSSRKFYVLDFTYSTESDKWIKVGKEIQD